VLFTTAAFVFLYLPFVMAGFFLIGRFSRGAAAAWLFAASVFFYGYWMPQYTLLLLGSILVNFITGKRIGGVPREAPDWRTRAKRWLIAGVTFNLVLLGYFKYANFFVDSLAAALGRELQIERILLPIGISFFTFTQIAFLADAYQKSLREYKPTHYGLFVTYFPHLVAGPVLHHAQMMPQFQTDATYRWQFANVAAGTAIFCLGLLKKVVVADGISPYADAVFNGAAAGAMPSAAEAWLGSLAYTFQLYFDFSGYSDMAIGLSWLFNVRLPFNFNSPYKSLNISDFWRRWHMTLSAFLRDYLYIPLGGNRHGPLRRYANLAITMVLGGLWHGANWTFVFWGALHGVYLGINHAFRAVTAGISAKLDASRVFAVVSWLLTFLAVIAAWVFFRAPTFQAATRILTRMADFGGWHLDVGDNRLLWNAGLDMTRGFWVCAVLAAVTVLGPNSNLIGERLRALCERDTLRRSLAFGFAATLVVFLIVLNESRDAVSAFIYFNF
jgi:alginate O-acetyltransferase complex protein AlgI